VLLFLASLPIAIAVGKFVLICFFFKSRYKNKKVGFKGLMKQKINYILEA